MGWGIDVGHRGIFWGERSCQSRHTVCFDTVGSKSSLLDIDPKISKTANYSMFDQALVSGVMDMDLNTGLRQAPHWSLIISIRAYFRILQPFGPCSLSATVGWCDGLAKSSSNLLRPNTRRSPSTRLQAVCLSQDPRVLAADCWLSERCTAQSNGSGPCRLLTDYNRHPK